MKLVIDISEELYKNVVEHTKRGYIGSDVWIAVANGRPLGADCWKYVDRQGVENDQRIIDKKNISIPKMCEDCHSQSYDMEAIMRCYKLEGYLFTYSERRETIDIHIFDTNRPIERVYLTKALSHDEFIDWCKAYIKKQEATNNG